MLQNVEPFENIWMTECLSRCSALSRCLTTAKYNVPVVWSEFC